MHWKLNTVVVVRFPRTSFQAASWSGYSYTALRGRVVEAEIKSSLHSCAANR
jgi:hypothetical protein